MCSAAPRLFNLDLIIKVLLHYIITTSCEEIRSSAHIILELFLYDEV